MKTYRVRVHIDIYVDTEIEAENEDQAKELGYDECKRRCDTYDVISNEAKLISDDEDQIEDEEG